MYHLSFFKFDDPDKARDLSITKHRSVPGLPGIGQTDILIFGLFLFLINLVENQEKKVRMCVRRAVVVPGQTGRFFHSVVDIESIVQKAHLRQASNCSNMSKTVNWELFVPTKSYFLFFSYSTMAILL